jgi:hypothetical protein
MQKEAPGPLSVPSPWVDYTLSQSFMKVRVVYWHRAVVYRILKKWKASHQSFRIPDTKQLTLKCMEHGSAFETARAAIRIEHGPVWRQFKCDCMEEVFEFVTDHCLLDNIPFEAAPHPFSGNSFNDDHFGAILKKTKTLLASLLDDRHPDPQDVLRISVQDIQKTVPQRSDGKALVSMLVDLADIKSKEAPLLQFSDFPEDTVLPFYKEHVRMCIEDMEQNVKAYMELFNAQKQTALTMLRDFRRTRARDDDRFDVYFDNRIVRGSGLERNNFTRKGIVVMKKAICKCNTVIDSVMKAKCPEHQLFRLPWTVTEEESVDGAHSGCAGV